MRPGNLHGLGRFWFGEGPKAKPKSKILHPDIYKFSLKHISPQIKKGATEVTEQIYAFDLFNPEFCQKLIEEAEFQGGWETGVDDEDSGLGMMKLDPSLFQSSRVENEKDTTVPLTGFPKVNGSSIIDTINTANKKFVAPLVDKKWRSFSITRYDPPYLLKYEPDKVKQMSLHYDLETVAMVVYLNTDFEGGGTYFPRFKYRVSPQRAGQAAMWPGGVSHEHIGLPITKGVRYLLCCAFF